MLGLKKGTVKLFPHDPKWKKSFEKEKDGLIKSDKGGIILEIYHIGSTSILGMPAKPIIDMVLSVKSLRQSKKIIKLLELNSFQHDSNDDLPDRLFFLKGPDNKRTHHLSVVEKNSENWQKYLIFVNKLKTDKILAKKYIKLKKKLATKFKNDRISYTNAKAKFIQKVINYTT